MLKTTTDGVEKKRCSKCRIEKSPSEFHRHNTARDELQHWCKKCFSARAKDRYQRPEVRAGQKRYAQSYRRRPGTKALRKKWCSTIHGKSLQIFWQTRRRAKSKQLEFDLDALWIEERLRQGCVLSGLQFVLTHNFLHIDSPSVDRINPSKGYTKTNCRLILFGLNAFKGADNDNHIFEIMRAVISRELSHKERGD